MPATYDVTGHALLSAKAAALAPDALDAYAQQAEELLGVHSTAFTGDALADVRLAIVRQLNRILTWEQHQGVVSMAKGGQSVSFGSGGAPAIDVIAGRIVRRLLGRDDAASSASVRTQTVWDAR